LLITFTTSPTYDPGSCSSCSSSRSMRTASAHTHAARVRRRNDPRLAKLCLYAGWPARRRRISARAGAAARVVPVRVARRCVVLRRVAAWPRLSCSARCAAPPVAAGSASCCARQSHTPQSSPCSTSSAPPARRRSSGSAACGAGGDGDVRARRHLR
jgi:hypothetical protein